MNLKAIVRSYHKNHRPEHKAELDSFRMGTLDSAIERAGLAIDEKGRKCRHQWRLTRQALEEAHRKLAENSGCIEGCQSFDELFKLVDNLVGPITGIGPVYVYDTSLRLGAWLQLLPTKVYLHAGTQVGAQALAQVLGFDGRAATLERSVLPPELQQLEPHEIEDVLCLYKDELRGATLKTAAQEVRQHSGCG